MEKNDRGNGSSALSLQTIASLNNRLRASLLHVLWSRRWTVLGGIVLALAVTIVYILQATPIFRSTSRLYVDQQGPRIMNEMQGYPARSTNFLYTQCELLRSTPILAEATQRPEIASLKTLAVANPVAFLKEALDVQVGRKDDIISVSLLSPYPQDASQIVNAIVDAYCDYSRSQKKNTAAEVQRILEKEKLNLDEDLKAKMQAMVEFRQQNGAISFETERGSNIILQRLAKLSEAMTQAQLELIEAQANLEASKSAAAEGAARRQWGQAKSGSGAYYAGASEETQLRVELNQLQSQRLTLLQECTADHPSVQAVEKKIEAKQADITRLNKELGQAQVDAAQQDYLVAQQREKQTREFFEQQQNDALGLNAQLAKYAMLQSDWEQTKKLSEILNDRLKEIRVTEDAGAMNITIVEAANPATIPDHPQKVRLLSLAIVVGLILGLLAAVSRDWLDQRLRSADETTAVLGLPVVGVVPMMNKRASLPDRGQHVHRSPTSAVAEAYRTIRTAVYFGLPSQQSKRLLITSPQPGDGKSTLASNLAIAIAQAGQKTILIDADFRRPTQQDIFELRSEQGMSSAMAGRASLEQVIQHTAVERLDVIPCGPIPPNPSEIINSPAFLKALEELGKRYDYVLIDSPPVMPITDARILGAMCGSTILAVWAGRSTRRLAEAARDGLLSVGAHILGTVINGAPVGDGRYGYGGKYGYYGRYVREERGSAGSPRGDGLHGEAAVSGSVKAER